MKLLSQFFCIILSPSRTKRQKEEEEEGDPEASSAGRRAEGEDRDHATDTVV